MSFDIAPEELGTEYEDVTCPVYLNPSQGFLGHRHMGHSLSRKTSERGEDN